jgi:hypothetical protein
LPVEPDVVILSTPRKSPLEHQEDAVTRNPTPSTPTSPWAGRIHLALTTILFAAALTIAGLAVAGRVKFGEAAKAVAPEAAAKPKSDGGRYQIQKVDSGRKLLECLGKTDFVETPLVDSWVFEYKGGLVEAKLETDYEGKVESPGSVPQNWKQFLRRDQSLKRDPAASLDRHGYIIVSAIRPALSLDELFPPYYVHLGGFLAFGSLGPLSVVPTLFVEVNQPRLYRVLVSANLNSDAPDGEFIVSSLQSLRIQAPLVAREPATENGRVGGGVDLKPGTEELLLDRERGYSRVRLKARFLTDGEARELLPK